MERASALRVMEFYAISELSNAGIPTANLCLTSEVSPLGAEILQKQTSMGHSEYYRIVRNQERMIP